MRLYCPTDEARVLLACRHAETGNAPAGAWLFPEGDARPFPGIALIPPPLTPIAGAVREAAADYLRQCGFDVVPAMIQLRELLEDPLRPVGATRDSDPTATLYLASVEIGPSGDFPTSWLTLPEILRSLATPSLQIPYVRAMQVLAGASEDTTTVLETDDIAKYFPH